MVAVVAGPSTAPLGLLNSAVKDSPGSLMVSRLMGTGTVIVLDPPAGKVKV